MEQLQVEFAAVAHRKLLGIIEHALAGYKPAIEEARAGASTPSIYGLPNVSYCGRLYVEIHKFMRRARTGCADHVTRKKKIDFSFPFRVWQQARAKGS